MKKLKKISYKKNTFIFCETKKEAKKLLKLGEKDLSLSFIHEKSSAVFEYEPDEDFWDKEKKGIYYNLYYRKRANKKIVNELNGTIINFKEAIKEKNKK